jgi:conjugal transfer pilus assembly protein TraU
MLDCDWSSDVCSSDLINGKCCQNLGESSILWGSAKEFPIAGEDFAYLLFRKRNCCMILY